MRKSGCSPDYFGEILRERAPLYRFRPVCRGLCQGEVTPLPQNRLGNASWLVWRATKNRRGCARRLYFERELVSPGMRAPRKIASLAIFCAFTTIGCQRAQSPQTSAISTVAAQAAASPENKTAPQNPEPAMLPGPNAVPKDTRVVINIPAFRMDVFRDGTLLKSYKIGIGYQQFPLPTGFRKAEMIIFNPTWTQPNESWASNPGMVVPAGSKGNPLGPIKIPIGGANLIHGGKALTKIGTFASHGCVGLTNDEVKDFAKTLAEASSTELKEETMAAFLSKRTRTQVVKLSKAIPVELRYETIVIQDGQLHIYRDVYNKNTNTEENLRAAFLANGLSFDKLRDDEKTKALEALNAMSLHPKKQPTPVPTPAANQTREEKAAAAAARKGEAERQRELRNRKEIVVDIAGLSAKGYPPPKDLHTGEGSVVSNAGTPTPRRPRKNPTPAPQSTPAAVQSPRNIADPR